MGRSKSRDNNRKKDGRRKRSRSRSRSSSRDGSRAATRRDRRDRLRDDSLPPYNPSRSSANAQHSGGSALPTPPQQVVTTTRNSKAVQLPPPRHTAQIIPATSIINAPPAVANALVAQGVDVYVQARKEYTRWCNFADMPPGWEVMKVAGKTVYVDHIGKNVYDDPPWVVWEGASRTFDGESPN